MAPEFPILDFAIALFIGALVGLEREKKQASEGEAAVGGIRTFMLYAEAGAVAGWLALKLAAMWIFIATGLCVTAAVLTGYYLHVKARPGAHGLTTEIAAVVVYLLGGTALFGYPTLAVALAIATSAILAFKQPIHGLVGKLGQDDLYAGLKLLIATFIVLPVLPNHTVDPWEALNPYTMWWLVILISSLSLVGYVASRWLGPEHGIPLTGLFGGLVSSTAVSLTFARRSRDETTSQMANALAAGLMLSWAVMFGRVLVAVAIVNAALLDPLWVPMVTMGLASLALGFVFYRKSAARPAPRSSVAVPLKNPFSLTAAIKFALFFTIVLLVVKLVQRHFSGQGLFLVAGLAGLTDVDAITLSMAHYAIQAGENSVAITAITIAAIANTLAKCGIVAFLGTPHLRRRMLIATAIVLVGAMAAIAIIPRVAPNSDRPPAPGAQDKKEATRTNDHGATNNSAPEARATTPLR